MATVAETRMSSVTSSLYNLFVTESPTNAASQPTRPLTPGLHRSSSSFASSGTSHGSSSGEVTSPSSQIVRARRAAGPLPVPEPTGCGIPGTTSTVVAIPVSSVVFLEFSLKLAKPSVDTALMNKNIVHVVFFGAVASTVPRLVQFATDGVLGLPKQNVHLMWGNLEELKSLSREESMKYLRLCKAAIVLGGDAGDAAEGAIWLMSRGQDVSEKSGTVSWTETTNVRWQDTLSSVEEMEMADFLEWLSSQPRSSPPSAVFLTGGSTMARADGAVLATTRRRLRIAHGAVMAEAEWFELSPLSILVSTWCGSTAYSIAPPDILAPDRSVPLDLLQYDVSVVLSTLIANGVKNFADLRGTLGARVVSGRENREVLRLVHWKADDAEYITLLPEMYVRFVLDDYYTSFMELSRAGPKSVLQSFVLLPADELVILEFPDLSGAEQKDANDEFGNRIWKLAPNRRLLVPPLRVGRPGEAIDNLENQTVFYAISDGGDSLEGLYVKWVLAPGGADLPTLDSAHSAFETVML